MAPIDSANLLGGGDLRPFGGANAIRHVAPQPRLQAIEIEIDDRCGVEGQELAQREPSNHGVTEWLTQFRAGAGAEREGDAGEHRRRRRHHDRPKT
jgi:hypothetical protein